MYSSAPCTSRVSLEGASLVCVGVNANKYTCVHHFFFCFTKLTQDVKKYQIDYHCMCYENHKFTYEPPVMEGHSTKKTFFNISDPMVTILLTVVECWLDISSCI